jgi:hypothetical protein
MISARARAALARLSRRAASVWVLCCFVFACALCAFCFPFFRFCAGEPGACAFFMLCFYALVLLAAFGVALLVRLLGALTFPLRSLSNSQKRKGEKRGVGK